MYKEENVKKQTFGFFSTGIGSVLKGMFWAFLISILGLFLASVLIAYTPVSENVAEFVTFIVPVLSAAICGMVSARSAKSRGYLRGALGGVFYIAVMYIISAVMTDCYALSAHILFLLPAVIASGAIGGIFGINTAK